MQFADEFPMTVTGKVQKYKMREQAIEELGLHEQATAYRGPGPLSWLTAQVILVTRHNS